MELLSTHQSLGFNELAEMIGVNAPSLNRLLKTLLAEGYLVKNKDLKYTLSLKTALISPNTILSRTLQGHGKPILEKLSKDYQVTAMIIAYTGSSMICLDKVVHPYNIVMQSINNIATDYHCSPWSFLLLNHLSSAESAFLLENESANYPEEVIILPDQALEVLLSHFEHHGYADDLGKTFKNVRRLAVPIYGPGDHLVAALCIGSFSSLLSDIAIESLSQSMIDKAKDLTKLLQNPSL